MFCLLDHPDKDALDPLNLDQWTFYVLPAARLGAAKFVTVGALRKMGVAALPYLTLREAVDAS